MIKRGEIWWADLGEPKGSEPGYRRPVLVVQDKTHREYAEVEVEAIPEDTAKTTLQLSVQLLKRHRDLRYHGNPDATAERFRLL